MASSALPHVSSSEPCELGLVTSVHLVHGVATELLQHAAAPVLALPHAAPAGHRVVVVVVPGNPGLVGFYDLFVARLARRWAAVGVLAIGHAGHSEAALDTTGVYDLDFQLQHKLAALRALASEQPDVRFVLVGHSIGAHIANKLLAAHGDELRIVRCVNLFPTLHSMRQQAGLLDYVTRPLLRHSVCAAAACIAYLPGPVRRAVLALAAPANERVRRLVSRALRFNLAHNCLYMARTEFDSVVAHDTDELQPHAERMFLYYGATDGWAPLAHYEAARSALPRHAVRLDELGVPHAFVVDHSEIVADAVFDWVEATGGRLDAL